MTEILLLGTFHFLESHTDFYSSEAQQQLDLLAKKLLLFQPDSVAVEAPSDSQRDIDISYEKFSLADLQNRNLMETKTLGKIFVFGQTCPITYNNEAIQVGYRLGKLLGHKTVYAIDNDAVLDSRVLKEPTPVLQEAMDALNESEKQHANDNILDMYRYYNSREWSTLNHNIYIQANAVGAGDSYAGADMVADWYKRNLKIFANIQRLALKSRRLFILIGAGHLHILQGLICAAGNMKLTDTNQYLPM